MARTYGHLFVVDDGTLKERDLKRLEEKGIIVIEVPAGRRAQLETLFFEDNTKDEWTEGYNQAMREVKETAMVEKAREEMAFITIKEND